MPNQDTQKLQPLFALCTLSTVSGPGFDKNSLEHAAYTWYAWHDVKGQLLQIWNGDSSPTDLGLLVVDEYRLSTDRNKALLTSLKKAPRKFELKTVQVRDVCKRERYYDYKKFRWSSRSPVLSVQRMVPVKRSLSALMKRQKGRVSNDLTYIGVSFPIRAYVTEVAFLYNEFPPNYPGDDWYKRRIVINGSLLSARIDGIQQYSPQSWQFKPFIDWRAAGSAYPYESPPLGWPGTYSNTDTPLVLSYLGNVLALEEKILPKLYSRIKDAKLDLATDLAEISQTIGLISNMAVTIGKSFLSLKKGNIFEALKHLVPTNRAEVSNAFLAFRYGVQPLMTDVEGAAQMLAERILNLPPQSVKTKKRQVLESVEVLGNFTVTVTTTIDVKYAVFYDLDGTETLSNLSRLGFTSPTNVTWELTPFSFVIDWFLPIGNYLGSLSALEGYKLREIVKTVSVKQRIFCDVFASSEPVQNAWYPEKDLATSWAVERIEVRSETIPSLPSLPLPRFRNPFTIGRALNALALLSQMIK